MTTLDVEDNFHAREVEEKPSILRQIKEFREAENKIEPEKESKEQNRER